MSSSAVATPSTPAPTPGASPDRRVRSRALAVARAVAATLALLLLLVFGPPAVLGWVPLPVGEAIPGVRAGTLLIVDPVESPATPAEGDVVAVLTGTDRLALRTVTSASDGSVTVASADGTSTTGPDRIRAVERYRLPGVGALYGAAPAPHRAWWARGLGALMLLWCFLEVWDARRCGGRHARPGGTRRWGRRTGSRDLATRGGPAGATATSALATRTDGGTSSHPDGDRAGAVDLGTLQSAPAPRPRRAVAAAYAVTDAENPGVGTSAVDADPAADDSRFAGPSLPGALPTPPAARSPTTGRATSNPAITSSGTTNPAATNPTTTNPGATNPATTNPATPEEALPTRRARAEARRHRRPWHRMTDAAASAVGAVVLAARALDRRTEDPEDADAGGGGRHRSPLPTRTVDPTPAARTTTTPTSATPTSAALPPGGDPTSSPAPGGTQASARSRRNGASTTPTGPADGRSAPAPRRSAGATPGPDRQAATPGASSAGPDGTRDLWRRRASREELRRAALIQDFEARRAAAEAAFRHELAQRALTSPAERLVAEREKDSPASTTPGDRTTTSADDPAANPRTRPRTDARDDPRHDDGA